MKRIRQRKKHQALTTKIIAGGFLATIIAGTFLLMLPYATVDGSVTPFIDALFTATSAVCVTGLVTVPTYSHWSFFGQGVIAVLIETGGLGLISFTAAFLLIIGKRLGFRERILIRDAYNLASMRGLHSLIATVFLSSFAAQGIGALLYASYFVPIYGLRGVWFSIFNAVSAFCNAGMDILGPSSLLPYRESCVVNLTTEVLIVSGGIGFPIWIALKGAYSRCKNGLPLSNSLRAVPLYAKAPISMTFFLIFGGALMIFMLEYTNPLTLAPLPLGQKIQAAFFQSITTRTAGFFTVPQEALRRGTCLFCCLLMFIGGSPSGTAGGIKTTTALVLFSNVKSIMQERSDTELFHKKVRLSLVHKSFAIFFVCLSVLTVSLFALCVVQPGTFEDCVYEVTSALGTVGLSRNFTGELNTGGKIIIIITMYLGRIGPISLALFFNSSRFVNLISYPRDKITVG